MQPNLGQLRKVNTGLVIDSLIISKLLHFVVLCSTKSVKRFLTLGLNRQRIQSCWLIRRLRYGISFLRLQFSLQCRNYQEREV